MVGNDNAPQGSTTRRALLAGGIAAVAAGGAWLWFGREDEGAPAPKGPKVLGPELDAPSSSGKPATPGGGTKPKWPVALPAYAAEPLHVGGMLYCGAPDGMVLALDDRHGAERWRYTLRGAGIPSPGRTELGPEVRVSSPELVAVGPALVCSIDLRSSNPTDNGRVVGLDAATGKERWRRSAAGKLIPASKLCLLLERPGTVDAPERHVLRAVEPHTGRQVWEFSRTGRSINEVHPHDGPVVLLALLEPPALCALEAQSGALVWNRASPGGERLRPFHQTPRIALFTSEELDDLNSPDGNTTVRVTCLNPSTGKLIWQRALRHAGLPPLVSSDGLVHLQGEGRMHALDTTTGAVRWTSPMPYEKSPWNFIVERGLLIARDPSNERSRAQLAAGIGQDPKHSLIRVLATASGAALGSFRVPGWPVNPLGSDGSRVFLRHDLPKDLPTDPVMSIVSAVDARSGRTVWEKKTPRPSRIEVQGPVLRLYGTSIDLIDCLTGRARG
ncbi:PQQ-binding-like beta-propeller repeat protein [Streptomyces sp. NPDC048442]|uniref:outer membrane protein assembly factor BamB family protein n=1 Tax=Streptomyces sp. NPDC048442 TaxID=3154823 RepID=UPI003440608F